MSKFQVFLLRITICKGKIEPPIWREILVKEDISLIVLHNIIQDIFAWERAHLYAFEIRGIRYEDLTSDPGFNEYKVTDLQGLLLASFIFCKGDEFMYEYDFGDDWNHTIEIKDVLSCDKNRKYPLCIGGDRNRPIEDCGGAGGYLDVLEALCDPSHEEHESTLEYLGGYYPSERFDIDEVNKELENYSPSGQRHKA